VGVINLKFWKKKDDLGLQDFKPIDPLGGNDLGLPKQDFGVTNPTADNFQLSQGFQQPQAQPFQQFQQQAPQQQFQQPQSFPSNNARDLDLVLAKLDAIKAEIDSLHQRIMRIERIAELSSEPTSQQAMRKYAREY
jgi:hypothetical protein